MEHNEIIPSPHTHDHAMHTSEMTMSMTFSAWSDYKLKLLFTWWDINDPWQYVLSWIVVVVCMVLFHLMKYVLVVIEREMKQVNSTSSSKVWYIAKLVPLVPGGSVLMKLRVIHALFNASMYAVSVYYNYYYYY